MFASVCVRRTARPSWALLLSCAHAPTQNAVRMVRAVVQTGSVTWTAAVKTATALTLWTQHDKTGQSHGPLWWSWKKKKKSLPDYWSTLECLKLSILFVLPVMQPPDWLRVCIRHLWGGAVWGLRWGGGCWFYSQQSLPRRWHQNKWLLRPGLLPPLQVGGQAVSEPISYPLTKIYPLDSGPSSYYILFLSTSECVVFSLWKVKNIWHT